MHFLVETCGYLSSGYGHQRFSLELEQSPYALADRNLTICMITVHLDFVAGSAGDLPGMQDVTTPSFLLKRY